MSQDNVVRLVPQTAGEDWRGSVDEVLEEARAAGLETVVVCGVTPDGGCWIGANASVLVQHWTLGRAMRHLMDLFT